MNRLYVAIMINNSRNHTYNLGIFTCIEKAKEAIEYEENFRGGKYVGYCTQEILDVETSSEVNDKENIVYKTGAFIQNEEEHHQKLKDKFEWLLYYTKQEEYLSELMSCVQGVKFSVGDDTTEFNRSSRLFKNMVMEVIIPIITSFQNNARLKKKGVAKNGK